MQKITTKRNKRSGFSIFNFKSWKRTGCPVHTYSYNSSSASLNYKTVELETKHVHAITFSVTWVHNFCSRRRRPAKPSTTLLLLMPHLHCLRRGPSRWYYLTVLHWFVDWKEKEQIIFSIIRPIHNAPTPFRHPVKHHLVDKVVMKYIFIWAEFG